MSARGQHGSQNQYRHHGCRCVACRDAKSAYDASYYAGHKDEVLARQASYKDDHEEQILAYHATYRADNRDAIREKDHQERAEFTEWLQVLRANSGCEDCETHEGLLVHHHVDPATKLYIISHMSRRPLDTLEDELEKCVVLCRSCHRKRHVAMRHEGNVAA